jgi:hypothetical protein
MPGCTGVAPFSAREVGGTADGICFTISRAIRHEAWMIHEMERSCRTASLWVSASIAALK